MAKNISSKYLKYQKKKNPSGLQDFSFSKLGILYCSQILKINRVVVKIRNIDRMVVEEWIFHPLYLYVKQLYGVLAQNICLIICVF